MEHSKRDVCVCFFFFIVHGLLTLIAINYDACVFDKEKYKKYFCVLYMAKTLTCFEYFFYIKKYKYLNFRKCVFAWIS